MEKNECSSKIGLSLNFCIVISETPTWSRFHDLDGLGSRSRVAAMGQLRLGMAMGIYLPMCIDADNRIIRHMSDIAQYMRIMRILMRVSAVPHGHPQPETQSSHPGHHHKTHFSHSCLVWFRQNLLLMDLWVDLFLLLCYAATPKIRFNRKLDHSGQKASKDPWHLTGR